MWRTPRATPTHGDVRGLGTGGTAPACEPPARAGDRTSARGDAVGQQQDRLCRYCDPAIRPADAAADGCCCQFRHPIPASCRAGGGRARPCHQASRLCWRKRQCGDRRHSATGEIVAGDLQDAQAPHSAALLGSPEPALGRVLGDRRDRHPLGSALDPAPAPGAAHGRRDLRAGPRQLRGHLPGELQGRSSWSARPGDRHPQLAAGRAVSAARLCRALFLRPDPRRRRPGIVPPRVHRV